jgi:hypothetical protein
VSAPNIPEINTVFVSVISSIVGGLIVAATNQLLTRYREKRQNFENLRIEYLIESWKKIERAACVGDEKGSDEVRKLYDDLEDAVASINLLGNPKEIEEAKRFAEALAAGTDPNCVRALLNSLRAALRGELGLQKVEPMSFFMRMKSRNQ